MGDHIRSPTTDFYGILGISKTATIKEMCKAYKSLVMKWNPEKSNSNKADAEIKFKEINDAYKAINLEKIEEKSTKPSTEGSFHHKSMDESFFSRPTVLLRSLSKKNNRSPSPSPNGSHPGSTNGRHNHGNINSPKPDTSLSKTTTIKSTASSDTTLSDSSSSRSKSATRSRRAAETKERARSKSTTRGRPSEYADVSGRSKSTTRGRPSESPDVSGRSKSTTRGRPSESPDVSGLSKSTTRRRASETEFPNVSGSRRSPSASSIVYSQSTARRKPSPIDTKLECTLEELCFGCVKHIQIKRDVIKNGIIEKEEEIVKIKVQPGWKKGTKITFEGKGDERPGYYPADIVFSIEETSHPLFQRIGDNLEYGVEIPLVNALTGCSISVPLLGGEKMSLTFDDIIYPGYEKVIPGQGMPISSDEHRRGNLRIQFLVNFPEELSDEQRSLALSILQDCS